MTKCSNCRRNKSVESIQVFETWSKGLYEFCDDCQIRNREGLRTRKGILLPDVVLYGTIKNEGAISELIEKVDHDCKVTPLVMVVGTSLSKEVVDTATIIKSFKQSGIWLVT
jgi:NAD-dependent SIR2 family protein deacetylase